MHFCPRENVIKLNAHFDKSQFLYLALYEILAQKRLQTRVLVFDQMVYDNSVKQNAFCFALATLRDKRVKPGLHEPQQPVERIVTLLSSIVVERRRCALQVSSLARLQ